MLSFTQIPFSRITEKVAATFLPPKKMEVRCKLSPGPQPFAMSHHQVYDRHAVHVWHHKHGWIPKDRSVFAKLSDFFFDDTPKMYREPKRPKQIRARANMSHLTPEQKKRLAQARKQRNNYNRRAGRR